METRKYEITYIIRPDIEESAKSELVARFDKILADNGANIIDSKDWSTIKAAKIYKEVVQNLKPDSVILLHSFEETVTILPEILDYIQNNSFCPRLLSEVNSKAIIFARNL